MTVLDLSGYDATAQEAAGNFSSDPLFVCAIVFISVAWVMGFILIGVSVIEDKENNSPWMSHLGGLFVFASTVVFCGLFLYGTMREAWATPSFASYVENAYGFSSSSLPRCKPGDGSLSVTWKQDGEIHSGTLNLLDNEVSIKETGGEYLEVKQ